MTLKHLHEELCCMADVDTTLAVLVNLKIVVAIFHVSMALGMRWGIVRAQKGSHRDLYVEKFK